METGIEHDYVMAIVVAALQRPIEEREAYVRTACEGDPELYREVTEALEWEDRMGSFLKEPLLDFAVLVQPFEAGQLLIDGRFEILREIGEGGMGVVYEAIDRKLQQRIAIKAAKPGFQRLLTPELTAALRVRHHNICLVKEIHTAQTQYGEIDFLAMEFLEGETLSAYLKKTGKLEHDEALDIACQVCAGLAEAHRSGIIHRDLKSGNVFICQNEDGSRRAVITDFGLAGGPASAGEMAGTPAYMAPELWRGEAPSEASDIYALGVIAYELVAGCRPYEREEDARLGKLSTLTLHGTTANDSPVERRSLLDVAVQPAERAHPPEPPSTWVKGLDARWDRVVMSCLEIAPADRPQDAGEVLAALQHEPINKKPFVIAGLVLAVIIAVVGLVRPLRQGVMDFIWPPNVRLAVLPYDGPKDLAAVAGGALQDVSRRLSDWSSGSRSVVSISPGDAKDLGVQTPEEAQTRLHATHALQTSAAKQGDDILIRGSVIDLETQTHVRDFSFRYTPATLGALPAALTGEVSAGLGLKGLPSDESLSQAATGPYDQALSFSQADQYQDAIPLFEEAARLDPRSPLPVAALIEAEVARYYQARDASLLVRAQQQLRTAESLGPDSVNVHLAAAKVYEVTGKLEKALDEYRRVHSLAPSNIKAARRAAWTYDRLDMPDKAVAEYRRAIAIDPSFFEPYRYFGGFYYYRGNYSAAAEQWRKVTELTPDSYHAWSDLATALQRLKRYNEAEQALRKGLSLREDPDLLQNMGALLGAQGRDEEAVPYYERAIALKPNEFVIWYNLGDSNRHLGRRKESRKDYEQALSLAKSQLQQNPQDSYARSHAALFAAYLNERAYALEQIGESLQAALADTSVVRQAVLTYEALGLRQQALDCLANATLEFLRGLDEEPDLADFRRDPRYQQLVAAKQTNGGN
jgi:serine/threonine protein kinase/tetratricopeptide (TPR) repeat protein